MINKILYKSVGLGGTFDHFHEGHKEFIRYAASFSKELIIGITNTKMTLDKPFNKTIEHPHTRSRSVKNFCDSEGIKTKIVQLSDPYGPAIERKGIYAIACTTDTVGGADKINEIRSKMRMKELPVHISKLVLDKEGTGPINSSRIRRGEIDREGNILANVLGQKDLKINESQRLFFSKPQGKIVEEPKNPKYLICVVGDSTLEKFVLNNWDYDLGIFDGKRERVIFDSEILNRLKIDQTINNKPGLISHEMTDNLKNWVKKQKIHHIFINGEEDLAAVSLALLLPLGSNIYYGQPNQGIIEMRVTEGLKHNILKALTD